MFDPEGLKVVANYTSGKQVDITAECTLPNSEPLISEDKTITVGYLEFTTELAITVSKVEMIAIEVTKVPNRIVYFTGEKVDLTGLELTAKFNNGSTMILSSGYTYTPETVTTDYAAVTLTYQGLSTTYAVTVLEPVINKIEITTPPVKVSYVTGEMIDVSGIKVTGEYTNGDVEDITNQCTFTPAGALTVDDTVIIATYNGLEATTPIKVTNFAPVSISISQMPSKTTYLEGDTPNLTGLIANVVFNDSTSTQLLNGDGVSVSPANNLQSTNSSLVISYTLNGVTVSTSINITVLDVDSTLDNNTWETISTIAEMGIAGEVWNVGDIKSVTVNGASYNFRIIGFNHDDKSDGSGKAGITFEMVDLLPDTYAFASSSTSLSNGWASSSFYTKDLVNLYESIESNLKPYIKTINKVSGKNGGITTDTHKLFILSTRELAETVSQISCAGSTKGTPKEGEGTVYEYYKVGNSIIKSAEYWTRSFVIKSSSTEYYARVLTTGTFRGVKPNTENKIALAFCI